MLTREHICYVQPFVRVASKMVLQIARQDIGQMTYVGLLSMSLLRQTAPSRKVVERFGSGAVVPARSLPILSLDPQRRQAARVSLG
jgi:hypothetical protein